jgi:hypothetical protein
LRSSQLSSLLLSSLSTIQDDPLDGTIILAIARELDEIGTGYRNEASEGPRWLASVFRAPSELEVML